MVTRLKVIFFFCLVLIIFNESIASGVQLRSNGYEGVTVSLPSNVPSHSKAQILSSLKELFASSSDVLFTATKRRAAFKNVNILIPPSWDDINLLLDVENLTILETHGGQPSYSDVDILITGELNRWRPYTLQAGNCGKSGVRIYLPLTFLLSEEGMHYKSVAFIHNWSQYRYGVFPEGGFFNDSRYPLYYNVPGTTDLKMTSCTNIQLTYNFTDDDGENCVPEVDKETGKPISVECKAVPNTGNEMLTSSILYSQALPHVSEFCDSDISVDKSHNVMSPSKHNVLCSEEGAWFVILRNPDFKKGNNQATRNQPELAFTYVQEKNMRIVVAVDVSSAMKIEDRYSLVKNALTKFILFDLPLGTELGLLFFSNGIETATDGLVALPTKESKIKFLETAIIHDEPESSSEACVTCAVQHGIQLLELKSTGGGLLILVTSTPEINRTTDFMSEKLRSANIRLFALHFSDEDCIYQFYPMTKIAQSTGGSFVNMPEGNRAKTLSYLYMSFTDMISELLSTEGVDSYLFFEETELSEANLSLTFHVDTSVTDLKFLITGPYFSLDEPTLIKSQTNLMSPSGEYMELHIEDYIPAWVYNVPFARAGNYMFRTKKKDSASGTILMVAFGKSAETDTRIHFHSWVEVQQETSGTAYIKIFAELRYGVHPITNAEVIATVHGPGNHTSFLLLDNGLGDPDITECDGIYSRYFVDATSCGYYSIFVRASDNREQAEILYVSQSDCCGSFMPSSRTKATGKFSRQSPSGSFQLANNSLEDFPPNQILDLGISKTSLEDMIYTLTWSAAGDNYDHGNASSYIVKLFHERTDAKRRFEETGLLLDYNREIIRHSEPCEYGCKQEFTIKLPNTLDSAHYYFAVKALDRLHNVGRVSNIVEVLVQNNLRNITVNCTGSDDSGHGASTEVAPNLHVAICLGCILQITMISSYLYT